LPPAALLLVSLPPVLLTDPELPVAAAGVTGVGVVDVTAGLVSTGAELPVATVDWLWIVGSCDATGVVSAGVVVPDPAALESLRAASFRSAHLCTPDFRATCFGAADLRPALVLSVVAVFDFALT
jgi:hypothetical protein